jgi:RNA ligase (TIGR02306 family)
MKPVDIVKIEKLLTIYKNGEEANAIQVARIQDLEGNSCEFNIIVGKGLYNIGDKVVYIMPDYCIPNSELFRSFHEPFNDPKKSRLGKRGRVKAIKFNMQFKDSEEIIYSNGILLPLNEVNDYLNKKYLYDDIQYKELDELLEVIKYVAEESNEGGGSSGLTKGDFPDFLTMSDEPRIEMKKSNINDAYENKEIISGTLKRDGSSITIYVRKDPSTLEYQKGICSRKQEKKLEQEYIASYKDIDGNLLHQYYNKDLKISGWYNDFKQKFYTNEEVSELKLEEIIAECRDKFVDCVKNNNYLDILEKYCIENNIQLGLRGELIGVGTQSKKINNDSKLPQTIIWYGVDDLSNEHGKRIHYGQEYNLKKLCTDLSFNYTEELFSGIFTYDELIKKCNEIFKYYKDTFNIVVEGIVLRSKESNRISCKYINPEYDANC